MQLKLPISHVDVSVPAWCLGFALLWPLVFLSFLLHSLAIGGDALNGKVENGRYFLWRTSRSGDTSPYLEVARQRYTANYVHAVATIIFVVPAGISMWRIVWPAMKQMRNENATKK
jgi:hypothetical protein